MLRHVKRTVVGGCLIAIGLGASWIVGYAVQYHKELLGYSILSLALIAASYYIGYGILEQ